MAKGKLLQGRMRTIRRLLALAHMVRVGPRTAIMVVTGIGGLLGSLGRLVWALHCV